MKKGEAPLGDQEVEEKILDKEGCAELDPVRGCAPRSGICNPNCTARLQKKTVAGCGGPTCSKPN